MPDNYGLALNPTGLLAKLFNNGVQRRPLPPQWAPDGMQRAGAGGENGPRSESWNWYAQQIALSQERLALYQDYDEMDQDDLIASVLDAIAEDGSQTDFMTGRRLWVESANPEIENFGMKTLDRLQAEDTSPGIIREIAKNGDCFEFLHQQRGLGVVAHEHVPPDQVWKYERDGQLAGFIMGTTPDPNPELLMLPWQFCHFYRTGGRRYPGPQYGDAWIRPARRIYRKFCMAEDAMVMYRLRRAPDRDVYYIDVGTYPPEQQMQIVKQWKRMFKKNMAYDPATGMLRGELNPLAYDEDIFWPASSGNNSKVERLSGSSNVGDVVDVEFLVNRLFSALRAPKEYFGFGESGAFDRGKSLEQQDVRWARGIKGLQQSCCRGFARIIQIDLALRGIDPTLETNQFTLKMTPVSALDETQRADLYDVRLRAMEGLTRVVVDLEGLDKKAWFKFLLEKFGGFRPGFLDKFIDEAKKDAKDGNAAAGSFGMEGKELSAAEKAMLVESLPYAVGNDIHGIATTGFHSSNLFDPIPRVAA